MRAVEYRHYSPFLSLSPLLPCIIYRPSVHCFAQKGPGYSPTFNVAKLSQQQEVELLGYTEAALAIIASYRPSNFPPTVIHPAPMPIVSFSRIKITRGGGEGTRNSSHSGSASESRGRAVTCHRASHDAFERSRKQREKERKRETEIVALFKKKQRASRRVS